MTKLLEARGITKSFGHVEVLRGVDLSIEPGKVVSLIGDNGAGKSTLVKILSGVLQQDSGEILIDGTATNISSAEQARSLGLETVYQDLALAPDLGPAENVFVGREVLKRGPLGWLGVLDNAHMRREAAKTFQSMGTDVKDMEAPVAALSGGQKQSVAICRSVMWAKRLVFMDEPTAALGVRQTRGVLDLIRRVADSGIAVILISHNMTDVLEASDEINVLRLGRCVAQYQRGQADIDTLVGAMTGALDGAR